MAAGRQQKPYHSDGDRGPAQSHRSHVVERFTLSTDGRELDDEITVTDPVMLAEPWLWGGSFLSLGDAAIPPWACEADEVAPAVDQGVPPSVTLWGPAVAVLVAAALAGVWWRSRRARVDPNPDTR